MKSKKKGKGSESADTRLQAPDSRLQTPDFIPWTLFMFFLTTSYGIFDIAGCKYKMYAAPSKDSQICLLELS